VLNTNDHSKNARSDLHPVCGAEDRTLSPSTLTCESLVVELLGVVMLVALGRTDDTVVSVVVEISGLESSAMAVV